MTGELDPGEEDARLAALAWYDLKPGETDAGFDDIARVAALIFDAPMALVSIIERDQIWFKASFGGSLEPLRRGGSFCSATILADGLLVVEDAAADERFRTNPLVCGESNIRFYAGAPIRTPEGHAVASLCVLDTRPHAATPVQRDALRVLADQVASQIATRRHTLEMRHRTALLDLVRTDLSQRSDAVRHIVETAANTLGVDRVGLWFYDEPRSAIVAEDLYIASTKTHETGNRLTAGDYPRYFEALAESRVIAADDARVDPSTAEFRDSYLIPLDVWSMLDVPVRSEGVVVGVLCHEHIGGPRVWTSADQEFAASLADLLGTVIEASRRKRTEEDLRELTTGLERRVEQRTLDLERSNSALVGAVRDLEAFCYSVSHDLRGPLRVINGFATLVEGSALVHEDDNARENAMRIRDNTIRMSDLLDALLAFFRLGRRPMQIEDVDMDHLLRETIASLALDSDLIEFCSNPLHHVTGDRALLGDVLGNLLTNAFKFSSRAPSPRVEVGCEVAGTEIIFHVRDNGVGFEVEHASRLFEPFQRLHATDGYDGTGVGLAIVRRIVERHGGRVWAESAPSKGATFRFALPRRAALLS